MSESRAASRYAKSLLGLASEKNVLEEVHADMLNFSSVCDQNRDFVLLLKNPVIKHDKKRAILSKVFGRSNKLTLAIFDIITRKNREPLLPAIAKEFDNQYNIFKGIEVASVTTAFPLDKGLKKQMEEIVMSISKRDNVQLEEKIDKDLIGGFV